jgi:N-acetylglucosaminyl-diphospho-decaprenol L-rhamnosyltransferase
MDLSIIIVNWRSADYLRKCLVTVLAETHLTDYEIIVIDSASYDGCDRMLREQFPQVRFIQSEHNVGFARANNMAFRASRGRNILFLNPDTEVVGSAIDTMLSWLRKLPQAGAVGCKLLNTDATVQTSCIQAFPTILNQFLDSDFLRSCFPRSSLWGVSPLFNPDSAPCRVDATSGACILVKRETFESVGCFAEDYFMFSEDVDLCYKLAQAGFQNYFLTSAQIIHHGGCSTANSGVNTFSSVMMRESRSRFFKKTRGGRYAFAYRSAMGVCAVCRLLLLGPGAIMRRIGIAGNHLGLASVAKWWAILKWSLGGEKWLEDYR